MPAEDAYLNVRSDQVSVRQTSLHGGRLLGMFWNGTRFGESRVQPTDDWRSLPYCDDGKPAGNRKLPSDVS